MKRVICSVSTSASKKLQEIEDVLGIRLKGGTYDLPDIEEAWREFYNDPQKYEGSVVVDMVLQWYKEIYPDKGYTDAYYLEQGAAPSKYRSNAGKI